MTLSLRPAFQQGKSRIEVDKNGYYTLVQWASRAFYYASEYTYNLAPQSQHGKTLIDAAIQGDNDKVQQLLKTLLPQIPEEDIGAALIYAIDKEHHQIVHTLISLARIKISEVFRAVALCHAAEKGNNQSVSALLKLPATPCRDGDVDYTVDEALLHALGHNETVTLFLTLARDEIFSESISEALIMADRNDYYDFVSTLLILAGDMLDADEICYVLSEVKNENLINTILTHLSSEILNEALDHAKEANITTLDNGEKEEHDKTIKIIGNFLLIKQIAALNGVSQEKIMPTIMATIKKAQNHPSQDKNRKSSDESPQELLTHAQAPLIAPLLQRHKRKTEVQLLAIPSGAHPTLEQTASKRRKKGHR